MRISARGDYATRAVLDLAVHHNDGGVSQIHSIAERQHIPFKYLQNILLTLKKGGILRSRRGNLGGYYLARPPEKITLGEVIRIIDGSLAPINCASRSAYEACPEEGSCGLKSVWVQTRNALSNILDNTTFTDVIKRTKGAQKIRSKAKAAQV